MSDLRIPLQVSGQGSGQAAGSSLSSLVYVGTYTQSLSPAGQKSEGIYIYHLNPAVGSLSLEQVVKDVVNPSYLAFHPSGQFFYSVNETGQINGQPGGGVSAFVVHPQTGRLSFLNQQLSKGADPCYLSIDHSGRAALVANYNSGTISLLPITSIFYLLVGMKKIKVRIS